MITSGGGAFGMTAASVISGYSTAGTPDPRAVYTLAKPLFIAPQISFKVDLQWPTALTLVQTPVFLYVALDGDLLRPVQ